MQRDCFLMKNVNTMVITHLKFHLIFFREYMKTFHTSHTEDPRFSHVSSNKVYNSQTMFKLKTKRFVLKENCGM
jgi:hypothetical protein